jgi:hypothetical protein
MNGTVELPGLKLAGEFLDALLGDFPLLGDFQAWRRRFGNERVFSAQAKIGKARTDQHSGFFLRQRLSLRHRKHLQYARAVFQSELASGVRIVDMERPSNFKHANARLQGVRHPHAQMEDA